MDPKLLKAAIAFSVQFKQATACSAPVWLLLEGKKARPYLEKSLKIGGEDLVGSAMELSRLLGLQLLSSPEMAKKS